MTSQSPECPVVCFLCLDSFQTKEKATALDLELLSRKFLVFIENHLDVPSEEWALDKARLKNALCFNCSSVISVLCSLYDNLCDIQAKLADKMGQLSSLLEGSKERMTRRKGKSLMETLERQLGVDGSDGKKVEEMRDLLGDKCEIYFKKTFHQKPLETSISGGEDHDRDNSEVGDNDSVDVKMENNSINGSSDDDDNYLQNDSNDFSNLDHNKMDEQDPDHSATSNDDDKNFDEDDEDPDFSLKKKTSIKKSPAEKGPFRCKLCGKGFGLKASVITHMKNIHDVIPPKPEKPFRCKFCPNKFGTRISLLSHISFKHRGHSILNRPFKCDTCGRGFTTQNGVVLHKKKMHATEPPTKYKEPEPSPLSYNCTECSMSFETRRQKTYHTYTIHNKQTDGEFIKNDTGDSIDDLQNGVYGELHNDSNDSLNLDTNKMGEEDQDYSAPTTSSSSSDHDDNSFDEDEDDADPDFSLQKEAPTSKKKFRDKPYSCDLCGKQFSNKFSIPPHKKNIHGTNPPKPEKPFSCKLCPNEFVTRNSLLSHISFKHRGHSILNRTFKCDICSRGFTTQNGVVLHKKKMHGIGPSTTPTYDPKKFPCDFCPKSFPDMTTWRRHLKAKHKSCSSDVFFPCKQCPLKFDTLQERVTHTNNVHKKDDDGQMTSSLSYSCTECSMSFETQRQKVHHTYTVHKKDNKTDCFMKRVQDAMRTDSSDQTEQSCVVCSQEFKSWKLLHSHLKVHEKVTANKKSQMCYFCDCLFCYEQSVWAHLKTCITHNFTTIEFPCDHADHLGYSQWVFKNPIELETHFKEDHEDCEILRCGSCGWPFLDKNMLEFHRLVHLPKIKCKYQCPGCSNTFLNTDTLQHHYNSIHGVSLKLYRCKYCSMGFAAKRAISLHSSWCRANNEDEREQVLEFLCSECPKSYETAYQLKNHVRMIHRTTQCPDCGVVLPKSKIVNHKIMKHGKEKFLCTLCGKAYKRRDQLQMHMSSHGQYKWICKYCGSGSRSSGHLRRHIGRMHKDKLAEEAAAKNIKH